MSGFGWVPSKALLGRDDHPQQPKTESCAPFIAGSSRWAGSAGCPPGSARAGRSSTAAQDRKLCPVHRSFIAMSGLAHSALTWSMRPIVLGAPSKLC